MRSGEGEGEAGGEDVSALREAARDLRYLANRGYPKDYALRFVCDHYRLPQEERFALLRVVVPETVANSRRRKLTDLCSARGQVYVDGYNVLITVESLLSGDPVYRCDDGVLRDVRGVFRNYGVSTQTDPAMTKVLGLLASAGIEDVQVLLDRQISKSGELAGWMRRKMAETGVRGTASTSNTVDRDLKASGGLVATGDGNVIDSVEGFLDLPAEVARVEGIEALRL